MRRTPWILGALLALAPACGDDDGVTIAGADSGEGVVIGGEDVPGWVTDLVGELPDGQVAFATETSFQFSTDTPATAIVEQFIDHLGPRTVLPGMPQSPDGGYWEFDRDSSVTVASNEDGSTFVSIGKP